MARTADGYSNWRKDLIGPLVIGTIQWGVWALGAQAAHRLKELGLRVADGGGKGPVRGEHR